MLTTKMVFLCPLQVKKQHWHTCTTHLPKGGQVNAMITRVAGCGKSTLLGLLQRDWDKYNFPYFKVAPIGVAAW